MMMDAQTPPRIRSFIEEHLTIEETAVVQAQFSSSIRPNQQVLWTGMAQDAAQAWADRNGLQTLTTAMGPLMNKKHPACPRKNKSQNQWAQYIHGASALFALRISRGDIVTILTQPPPQRFHPSGATSFQAIEEPIIKGELGNRAVKRIEVVHPTVCEASGMRYQMWPEDESAKWISTFGSQSVEMKWREVKLGQIDSVYVSTALTRPCFSGRLASTTPTQGRYEHERKCLQERQAREISKLAKAQVPKMRSLREGQRQDVLRLEETQSQERNALGKKEKRSALHRRHGKEMRKLQKELRHARLTLQEGEKSKQEALKRQHKIALLQLQQKHTGKGTDSVEKQSEQEALKKQHKTALLQLQQNPTGKRTDSVEKQSEQEPLKRQHKSTLRPLQQKHTGKRTDSVEKQKASARPLCSRCMQSQASINKPEQRVASMDFILISIFVALCLRSLLEV